MTRQEQQKQGFKEAWRYLRPLAVGLLSLLLVGVGISLGVRYVLSHFIFPVDAEDNTPIEVVIPKGSSASKIASLLYNARGQDEPGLIVSTASFKVYVDFVGKANALKAGTYVLSRNMSISEIVEILCQGNEARTTLRFTIPEGYTVESIAAVLKEGGVLESNDTFLSLCREGSLYGSYSFIDELEEDPGRRYMLEGYLFPDTYEVYQGVSCDEILSKMLSRFNEIFTEAYRARARELGMSVDQVVTLASIIEKEAAAEGDFARVSAVFHNRLKRDMALESCATLSYVLGVKKYTFEKQ
ncbi:MAG: endolytic transglycosylase MltG, partial [Eubacteriales bacterium]|nr:endolytic transglycosylase MltG [Eubacteriales bacterium]